MKLRRIKNFVGSKISDVATYLSVDLNQFLNTVGVAISHLNFADNFDSFKEEFTIASGATITIANRLGTGDLDWFPVRILGDNRLVEGGQAWTKERIFIKNAGAVSITATVCFIRRGL